LKTIVAFLNTDGGTLLLGVSDNRVITGIGVDSVLQDPDGYILSFGNKIETRIGSVFSGHIKYDIVEVDRHHVLKVECNPSKIPCYYKEKDTEMFFVRSGASTKPILNKDEQERYIKNYMESYYDDRCYEWRLHKYGKQSHDVSVS